MTTNPTDQPSPLSPFDAYYRKPSPIGALDLAISDAKSHRDFEFSDQLCKLRDTYADSQRKIWELNKQSEAFAKVIIKLCCAHVNAARATDFSVHCDEFIEEARQLLPAARALLKSTE